MKIARLNDLPSAVWLLIHTTLLACAISIAPHAWAQQALPPVTVRLKPVNQQVAVQNQGARVAELLVDCSSSMGFRRDVNQGEGPNNPERWGLVRSGLEQCLRDLLAASPGIEVRVHFFGTKFPCLPSIFQRLLQPVDVANIMAAVPIQQPNKGSTLLFESIFQIASRLTIEHAQRKFEWVVFVVFSDGEDDTSAPMFRKGGAKDFAKAINAMTAAIPGAEARALIVGANVQAFANAGGFGPLGVGPLGQKIPVPPKPVPLFEVVPPEPGAIAAGVVARPGKYLIPVSVERTEKGKPQLELQVTSPAAGAFRLKSQQVLIGDDGKGQIEVELAAQPDSAAGVALWLRLRPVSTDAAAARIEGSQDLTVSFIASETLPPERWTFGGLPEHVRIGAPISLAVVAGKLGNAPKWKFSAQGQAAIEREGTTTTVQLPTQGRWSVVIDAVSDSQLQMTRQVGVIEAVDADFELISPSQRPQVDKPVVVAIERKGTSPAKWTARLDSEEIAMPRGAERGIEIPAEMLKRPGLRRLHVQARSELGGYEWSRQLDLDVDVSAQISVVNADFVEGDAEVGVELLVTGDVGGSILVSVDGEPERAIVVDGAQKVRAVVVPVRTAELKSERVSIRARASNNSCPELRAEIRGKAAQIGLAMKKPVDGARISAAGRTEAGGAELELEAVGADFDRFIAQGSTQAVPKHDLEFEISFSRGDAKPAPTDTGFVARGPAWSVSLPADPNPGAIVVWARPRGPRLKPELFPATSEWHRIGTLQVARTAVRIVVVGEAGKNVDAADVVVPPGKSIALRAVGPSQQDIEKVKWTFGPLAGDPKMGITRQVLDSVAESESIVPKAWGTLPVEARVVLRREGAELEAAKASIVVRGQSPSAQPSAPATVNTASANSASEKGFDVVPKVAGDFEALWVEVHERFEPAVESKPLWRSQEFTKDPGTISVPSRREDGRRLPEEIDVVFRIRSYPGDPKPLAPIARRVRFVLPSLQILVLAGEGKALPAAESELHPGEERTILLSGVEFTERDAVQWEIGPLAEDPDYATAQQRGPGPASNQIVRPQACGMLSLKAKVRLSDGTELQAFETVPVVAEIPSIAPSLERSRVTEGTKSVRISLNAKGRYRFLQSALYSRGGFEKGDKALWTSQKFGADPGQIEVPLEFTDGTHAPSQFEVAVTVEGYPGCGGSGASAASSAAGSSVIVSGAIVPAPQWVEWILSIGVLIAVGVALWKWLNGNDPLRWTLEFSFKDPGPPSNHGFQPLQIDIGARRSALSEAEREYRGWSRPDKRAFVPLWVLADADGTEDSQWLKDPQYASLTAEILRYWQDPFKKVPGPEEGWADFEVAHPEFDGGGTDRFSKTIMLSPGAQPGRVRRRIWMRMRCPRGTDPLFWLFWTWVGVSIAVAAALLLKFHIV